jgi:hypothetical protein
MRKDNVAEFYLELREDGRVIITIEHKDGWGGMGVLSEESAEYFRRLAKWERDKQ